MASRTCSAALQGTAALRGCSERPRTQLACIAPPPAGVRVNKLSAKPRCRRRRGRGQQRGRFVRGRALPSRHHSASLQGHRAHRDPRALLHPPRPHAPARAAAGVASLALREALHLQKSAAPRSHCSPPRLLNAGRGACGGWPKVCRWGQHRAAQQECRCIQNHVPRMRAQAQAAAGQVARCSSCCLSGRRECLRC